MRVALRVDASAAIGSGHLQRCLSLAQALVEQGAEVTLLTRALDGVAGQLLRTSAWPVVWLPPPAGGPEAVPATALPPHHAWAGVAWVQDAAETAAALYAAPPDWLIVDHYAFDARWHGEMRRRLDCRLLVIDDLGDRPIDADVLLDHNWASDHREKYRGRLKQEPVWLVGPRFALLSGAYRDAPRYRFHPEVRSLGIFMGGTDPAGITAQVLDCVRHQVQFDGAVEVVSTSSNPQLGELQRACAVSPNTLLTLDQPDLAAFFARHDLQIGAGGGATWERCCIGAPTIALAVAANQAATVPGLHRLGALCAAYLPDAAQARLMSDAQPLATVLNDLIDDPRSRQQLGATAATLVDGRGAQRVAASLMQDVLQLRPAMMSDAETLHAWRNHPVVRSAALNGAEIDYSDHLVWMESVLSNEDRFLLIGQIGQLAIGSIRFDRLEARALEVSLYLDPDLQGLGLGQKLLLCGENYISNMFKSDISIHAKVIQGNLASHKLFESSGYSGGPAQYLKNLNHLVCGMES